MKVCIITGASKGIGLATAKLFASKGFKVYGIARSATNETAFECLQADVNDAERMRQIIDEVKAKEGRIDVFINNAGYGIGGEHVNSSAQDIKNLIATNFTAVAVNMAEVGKVMKEQGFGTIISTSSLACFFPVPYQALYSATKTAIDTLTRTVRTELKPYNVHVCEVLPGDVATNFTDARVKNQGERGEVEQAVNKFEKSEREGMSPDKVAKAFYRLATAKNPRLRICVGWLKILIILVKILPSSALDWLIKKLYC
ncbi:MAG: SDR family NAD(P)-dependent oxidoreductase [Bacteroidales bacterium]|mgnify:CR=1 FL=1|nr:SDR family NAD(P)-dependent oxidoreductase [Bacteroidales bacterium]